MTPASAPPSPPDTQALDCFFSRLAGGLAGDAIPAGPGAPADFSEPRQPPRVENAADLRAAHEWLTREQQRLEMYTRAQLARIQQEHQAFIQQSHFKEQALVLRAQELNRKDEMLAHQTGALRQEAAALAERQRKLAPYLDSLWKGQEELAELRRLSAALMADTKGQWALLERLRAEARSVEEARAASEAELAARAAALRGEKDALAARQAEMHKRVLALEEAEGTARRREAELNELEARLRRDFEEQEERLARLRRESAVLAGDTKGQRALLGRLRSESASIVKAQAAAQSEFAARAAALRQQRAALDAGQVEMSRRLRDLERAEAAAGRREAELHELEARLRRDCEEQEAELAVQRRAVEAAGACPL